MEYIDVESECEEPRINRSTVIVMDEARGCKDIKLTETNYATLSDEMRNRIRFLRYNKEIVILNDKIYDFNITKVKKTFEDYAIGDPKRYPEMEKWSRKKSYNRIVNCECCDIDLKNGTLREHEKTSRHQENFKRFIE